MITPRFTIDIKKGKKNCPIRARYCVGTQKAEYYTRLHVDETYFVPKYWKGNKRAIKASTHSDFINEQLDIIVGHFHTAENKALAAGIALSVEYFKDYLNNQLKNKPAAKQPEQLTFIQFFDQVIEGMKGTQIAVVTRRRYATVKTMLEDFEKKRNAVIQWDEFDKKLFDEIITYQVDVKKYATNTIGRNTRTIKTILNKAIQEGISVNIKYQGAFKSTSEAVDNAYLTEAELETLYKHDFSDNPRNDRVRDLFLIGCWTGLRFSDFSDIRPEHINGDMLKMVTQKTKQQVIIPLHPVVKEILKKYNYELPPAISNQKFNDYLFEVCRDAKINDTYTKTITKAGKREVLTGQKHKYITSHSARRSFATNAFKRGISPYLIMTITGHKTESEFIKYLKVTADERAAMFAKEAKW
ncbi:MAG: site-specific integrase [Ferruginibacter sp.]